MGRADPGSSRGFPRTENQDRNPKIMGKNWDKKAGKERGAGGNGESFPGQFQRFHPGSCSPEIPHFSWEKAAFWLLGRSGIIPGPWIPPFPVLQPQFPIFPLPSPPFTGKFRSFFSLKKPGKSPKSPLRFPLGVFLLFPGFF